MCARWIALEPGQSEAQLLSGLRLDDRNSAAVPSCERAATLRLIQLCGGEWVSGFGVPGGLTSGDEHAAVR